MNYLDYGIIAVYLVSMLLLGHYFRDSSTGRDYFLGTKGFGWFPIGLSVLATQLSAVSFLSVPAFVGAKAGGGMLWVSGELHAPLTMLFLMVVLIPPLYRAKVISIYGFLEERLGPSIRKIVSGIFLVNRALATGIMIYAVCLLLDSTMGIPFWWGLVLMGVITVIYSWEGGMRAVVYGDASQMIILFLGMLACIYFGIDALGGTGQWLTALDPARVVAVDMDAIGIGGDGDYGFWPMLIGGFFISVAYYGTDQSEAQRFLSSADLPTLRQSMLFVGLVRYPVMCLYGIIGLVVGPLMLRDVTYGTEIAGDADRMMPYFINEYLPNGVIGLIVVAILASAMSSLSSAVNSLSAVTIDTLQRAFGKTDAARTVRRSRLASIAWGGVILGVASFVGGANDTLVEVIAQIGSISFAPILAVFLLAILVPGASQTAAIAGLAAGVGLNLFLWLGVGDVLFWIWWNVTGFVAAFGVGALLTYFAPAASPDNYDLDLRPDWKSLRSREAMLLIIWFFLMVYVSFSWPDLLT